MKWYSYLSSVSNSFNEKFRNSRLQNFLANDWEKTREEGEGQQDHLEQNLKMKFTLISQNHTDLQEEFCNPS